MFYGITKNILSTSGPDDDLRPHRRNPDFDAGVAVFGQLSGQDLVQFGEEHSISDELRQKKKKSEYNLERRKMLFGWWESEEKIGGVPFAFCSFE